jgi:hypothetical protein
MQTTRSGSSKCSLFALPAQFWRQMDIKMAQKEANNKGVVGVEAAAAAASEMEEDDAERRQMVEEAKERGLTCRTCDQFFGSVEAQQAHFKGEWHLFNLQRKLVDQARVDEATFTALRDESLQLAADEGDEDEGDNPHSPSGSSSEDEEDEDGDGGRRRGNKKNRAPEKGPRMRVTTSDGRVISFWRAILPSRDFEDRHASLTFSQEQGRSVSSLSFYLFLIFIAIK